VRSLQAALMAALAMGELFRLKAGARAALVGIAFLAALLTNVARTTFLALSAAHDGIGAVAKWHDPAGFAVLTVCLIAIAVCANFLHGRYGRGVPEATPASLPPLPVAAGGALTAWLVLIVAGGELWFYQAAEGRLDGWTIQPPPGAKAQTLPEASLALLGCDRTRAATWRDRAGAEWTLFFLEWFPSRSRTALLARTHRPEICLPGSGYTESAERRMIEVRAGGHDLRFQSMQFRDAHGRDLFVFYGAWEMSPGHPGRNVTFSDDTRTTSLLRVWQRERLLAQQVAELFVVGAPSREAAEESLRTQVGALVTARKE
jgi:exosortase/archaeosortase family protein